MPPDEERRVTIGDIREIKDTLHSILKILNGAEGEGGLVTKVALQEQTIKDLPSPTTLKFYASIGGGMVMILGMLGYAVVRLIKDS
jgi:hypothetical protein